MPEISVSYITIDLKKIAQSAGLARPNLVTRPTGRAVREAIESCLPERPLSVILVDFARVSVLDFSCADEVVAQLLLRYLPSSRPRNAFFLFKTIDSAHLRPLQEVLHRHKLAAVCDAGEGVFRLLGDVSEEEKTAWAALEERGRMAPATVEGCLGKGGDPLLYRLSKRRLVFRHANGEAAALSTLGNHRSPPKTQCRMTHDSKKPKKLCLATHAVHAGQPKTRPGDPVVQPIVRSSTFRWSGPTDGVDLRYSRYGNNPNQLSVSAKVAALEGTEAAQVLASGMAATAMTFLSLTGVGDHIVASRHLYGATYALLAHELPKRGIMTTFVEPDDSAAWAEALTPSTRVVFFELPVNPTLRVMEIEPARAAAQKAGAVLAADVTFATPMNFRATDNGIDAIIHSATKFLGGHSDLIGGAVAGSHKLVQGVTDMMKLYGPSLDPQAAWLLERGLRSLPARMERHNRNALALADWFCGVSGVRQVIYPGLANHPDHERAARLMPGGFGGVLSIVLEGGGAAADRFCAALKLATPAPSLGGVETLVSQPRFTSHTDLTAQERENLGIPDGFIRISVGLEDVEDLKADFEAAATSAIT